MRRSIIKKGNVVAFEKTPLISLGCELVPVHYHDYEYGVILIFVTDNRPRSIYQYSNMAPRLPGQTSIFGVVFFVSKSLLGIERQKKLENFAILTRKPWSHA